MTSPSSFAERVSSYVEHLPLRSLAGSVRTAWVQSVGGGPYIQRHLPTGGVELHWPLGGRPQVLGPLTGPMVESIPAGVIVIGLRFHPNAAVLGTAALDDLVDQRVAVDDIGHRWVDRVGEALVLAPTPEAALALLQRHLPHHAPAGWRDPLVDEAVRQLMPWSPVTVASLADDLGLSTSQLRRRCIRALGVGPKSLQRTLRFQGFLALAQAGASASGRRDADGMATLAADVGYADQAHLSREVRRLTGLTPTELLGGNLDRCRCGHDHTASYAPFLAGRYNAARRVEVAGTRDLFKTWAPGGI